MDTQNFSDIVGKFINFNPTSGSYDRAKITQLADAFQVSLMTVVRWVEGSAKPHKLIKEQVVAFVGKITGA